MSVSSVTKNLFWIIKNGSKDDIMQMLQQEKEVELNVPDEDEKTVLTMTLANDNLTEKDVIDVLEYLLDRGADPDIENRVGKTALLEAAASFKKDVVELLIRREANIDPICIRGDTITHHLVRGWMFEYDRAFRKKSDDELKIMEVEYASYAEWLMKKGLDFQSINKYGVSALCQSLEFGLHHISHVILQHTQRINDVGKDKKNLLHRFFDKDGYLHKRYQQAEAEKWQKFNSRYASKIIEILLDKGLSSVAFDKMRKTPLRLAVAREEAIEIIELLLERSVWSNHQRSDKVVTTVLIELFKASGRWGDEARSNYFLNAARTLIDEGANVNRKDSSGKTAIYYAFQSQNRRATDLLDESGADFSLLYSGQRNLYHVLAESKNAKDKDQEALFDLIASKACCDVNAKVRFARTPLHYAAGSANLTIARKLIQQGALVNAKDSDGSTALHLAVGLRDAIKGDELVDLLLKSGAEVNLKNHSGKRPLGCITSFASNRSVHLLLQNGALVNDYQDGDPIFCWICRSKGFECAIEMLAYGLDINDSRICEFFQAQVAYHEELLTEFFWRYSIKHKVAELPCSDYYNLFTYDCQATREYYERCLGEVTKLKNNSIDSQTSLYDYLHMDLDIRVIHNHNQELKSLISCPVQLEQQFAEYSVLILARYRTAVRWKSLLEPAKEAWLEITDIALPDICIERIFIHLSIEDLVIFIENASM